jgi:hypothetical protein
VKKSPEQQNALPAENGTSAGGGHVDRGNTNATPAASKIRRCKCDTCSIVYDVSEVEVDIFKVIYTKNTASIEHGAHRVGQVETLNVCEGCKNTFLHLFEDVADIMYLGSQSKVVC